MPYDIIIIGGGPAGTAAGVYAGRKKLKTLLITESFGGQSVASDDIHNWIGEKSISGIDLAKKFEEHVRTYADSVEIKTPQRVKKISKTDCRDDDRICDFEVETEKGDSYKAKAVIIVAGARRRKLGITGEDKFEGRGVAYCSTCDAPLFSGMKVAVVGGGNSGLEAVQDLFPYASEIYLVHRGEALKGDKSTQDKIKQNPKLKEIILNSEPTEILGDKMVSGMKYKVNPPTGGGEEKELEVGGVFVEIGSVPNSEMAKDLVELDDYGQIKIDAKHASTSQPGVFAAGDITDDPYKQNNISAGDGVRAALAAYSYLLKREKESPAAED